MTMNWKLDRAQVQGKVVNNFVVDGSALVPPKLLRLWATGIGRNVASFEVFKYHDSAIRQILRHFRVSDITRFRPPITLEAKADGASYKSKALWALPTANSALKKRSAFLFCADGGVDKSGVVFSTRKAVATVKTRSGGTVHAAVPPAKGSAKFDRAVTVKIVWAVDPNMIVTVLTGEGLVEHALSLVEDAIEDDDHLRGKFDAELEDLRQALPLTYQGPKDWQLEAPSRVHGDEGETTEFDVDFIAASEGMGYFAFLLSDPESPDDDEVSSIFALEVTREGDRMTLSVITDFDGMELRLPVM
ncbi:hypothetical protein GO011_11745 [Mycobacterium sp. 20091114027_K0903767]|nr:hypothetical protein [Mycobacterium sp. 20091114027_K0903767]